ncbi:thioesterase super member 6 [Aspergillus brasiliensis]|uniref:Thioesterase super member 6 n=1 Tax=Aspergillus brasiliensis TaxID=319629 RepID=A0A9W5YYD0_9EURO|nr:thioesterase super member 6 [Aspergillus brasiliensis]GKZ48715.1 thioesterase super member 6 [Aspergillus brasiliensis]
MGFWMWCLGLILGLNLKNLPFMWHFRFFGALAVGYLTRRRSRYALQQHHVILPAVVKSRSPATEGDFNIHKSNSTYITDLDVSRAHLSGLLFGPFFLQNTFSMRCNLIVSAIACTFHREIKPFQPYEICTRVASWDDKWIYMVTHFVDNSTVGPRRYVVQQADATMESKPGGPARHKTEQTKTVFASAVTRMVFKRGRLTVPPDRALEICGLLSTADSTTASSNLDTGTGTTDSAAGFGFRELKLREMISYKETNLPIVRLERGWDAVRELFREEQLVLAEYVDFMW